MKWEDQSAISGMDLAARKAFVNYVEERHAAEGWWDTSRAGRLKALTVGQLIEGLSHADTHADLSDAKKVLGEHFDAILDGLRKLDAGITVKDFIAHTHEDASQASQRQQEERAAEERRYQKPLDAVRSTQTRRLSDLSRLRQGIDPFEDSDERGR